MLKIVESKNGNQKMPAVNAGGLTSSLLRGGVRQNPSQSQRKVICKRCSMFFSRQFGENLKDIGKK
jgi:hypothetical protein